MRAYSLLTILLLCVGILVIDILAFYWLQSITNLIAAEGIKKGIHILFWVFTIGLISGIILLKLRLDFIVPQKRHQLIASLYGLAISSFLPKLIFVVIISILYFANQVFSENASLIIVPLVGLFSGFLPFFFIVYGIFGSLYKYKIQRINLPLSQLPKSFNDLRVVQISDLHLGSFNFNYHQLDKAITMINKLKPDYIFFTGDLVNNYAWELKGWAPVFQKMSAAKGKFAILGNHDYGDYSEWETEAAKQANLEGIKDFFSEVDFKLLLNEAVQVDHEDGSLAIVGVENWGAPPFKQYGDLQQALATVADIPCKLLLSHDPTHWPAEVLEDNSILLTLSGHTHGMQAGIQINGKQWSPIKYKYQHWAGLYQEKGQYLYVNRGLGWIGFPGRLGMRPEITLIVLKSGE